MERYKQSSPQIGETLDPYILPDKSNRATKPALTLCVLLSLLASLALLAAGCSDDPPPVRPTISLGSVTPGPITSPQPGGTGSLQPEVTATPQPPAYVGEPTDPQPAPSQSSLTTLYFTETAHYLRGDFLSYYRNNPKSADLFGLPISEEFPQQFSGSGVYRVQYFERARLEWHPELPDGSKVQLGAVAREALDGRIFGRLPTLPNTANRIYLPETGHTISSGFLNYWKANGDMRIFGLPLSEEMGEDGVTVQYFERARFEYHSGLEGNPYAVQLSPVGYMALKVARFSLPLGVMVRFNPPRVAEGHTAVLEVAASPGVTVTGQYEGRSLTFKYDGQRGIAWSLIGTVPFQDTGFRQVSITLQGVGNNRRTLTRNLEVVTYPFPSESLDFADQTAKLLDPALTGKETQTLNSIFSGRTPLQYWSGPFRMPLNGQIRITSYFATRRCYECPAGSKPTTYHGGMDMGVAEGTSVLAPADGKVVFAGPLAVRGNAVIIDHGLGVYSLFAHNSRLIATVGQVVHKGDVVSLSGNTGLSNGPHLHWELHVNGPPVEPREWVNRTIP
jgi:murein DD-endopeptidase MepM/ murein hydrolase activator NlpD